MKQEQHSQPPVNVLPNHTLFDKIRQWIFPQSEVVTWKVGTRLTLLVIGTQGLSLALLFLIINTIVLVQDHTISHSPEGDNYEILSDNSTLQTTKGALLVLGFQDNTSIQQVQNLFEKHQLNFINGPNPAGLYTVQNQSKQSQTLLRTKLQSEGQIISFIKTAN